MTFVVCSFPPVSQIPIKRCVFHFVCWLRVCNVVVVRYSIDVFNVKSKVQEIMRGKEHKSINYQSHIIFISRKVYVQHFLCCSNKMFYFLIEGIGIIDFEHWRPIWRQNWMSLAVYKNYSRVVERRKHPRWKKQDIEVEVGGTLTFFFISMIVFYLA